MQLQDCLQWAGCAGLWFDANVLLKWGWIWGLYLRWVALLCPGPQGDSHCGHWPALADLFKTKRGAYTNSGQWFGLPILIPKFKASQVLWHPNTGVPGFTNPVLKDQQFIFQRFLDLSGSKRPFFFPDELFHEQWLDTKSWLKKLLSYSRASVAGPWTNKLAVQLAETKHLCIRDELIVVFL